MVAALLPDIALVCREIHSDLLAEPALGSSLIGMCLNGSEPQSKETPTLTLFLHQTLSLSVDPSPVHPCPELLTQAFFPFNPDLIQLRLMILPKLETWITSLLPRVPRRA